MKVGRTLVISLMERETSRVDTGLKTLSRYNWMHNLSRVSAVMKERKMSLRYEVLMEILRPMLDAGSTSFNVIGEGHERWRYFCIVVSYC